jgi:hypothetical protein
LSFFISTYLPAIPERLGEHMKMMKEDLGEIEKLAIMVDADEGYLANFTKPFQDKTNSCFLKSFKEWDQRFWSRELQGTLNP